MTFATLPLWGVLGGVPLLAGILYLLQRLRSERRVVAFAAARLWEQAARDPILRVRGPRFRYWLAFAVSLAIVLLMWFAVAVPTPAGGPGQRGFRLFYLDDSALMTGNGELAAAKRALLADVRGVAPSNRAVVLGDATATRLLAPGESSSLLAARLDGIAAGARPSSVGDWIAAQPVANGRTLDVTYYGAWGAVRNATRPEGVRLRYGYLAPAVPNNRGIVALGVSPAASGAWSKADLLVTLAGSRGWTPRVGDLRIVQDGRPLDLAGLVAGPAGRFLLRDVDADGRILEASLRRGDGFAADDRAAIRLPDRTPIRIALSPAVPATIRAVIARDDAFVAVPPERAGVVVRRAGETFGGDLPALILTDAETEPETFLFSGPGEDRVDLARRLGDYGLAQIDAAGLADRLRRPISVDVAAAPTRSIQAWTVLFDAASPFAKTADLPLFVSRSLRWLAGEEGWTPYGKAGAPLPDQSGLTSWSSTAPGAGRGLGEQVYAGDAGDLRLDGRTFAVALTDRATTAAAAMVPPPGITTTRGLSALLPPDPLFAILALFAFLLLAGEWIAYQRGWMP